MSYRRLGISPLWNKAWASAQNLRQAREARLQKQLIPALSHYAAHGVSPSPIVDGVEMRAPQDPARPEWEYYLPDDLMGYALAKQFELELKAVTGEFDTDLAASAFASAYTSEVINLHIHQQFPHRFEGRRLKMMSMRFLAFSSLGVILGIPEALGLARMQLRAYSRGDYLNKGDYPILEFVLRVLADYLGELDAGAANVGEPGLDWLFEVWREAEANALYEPMLAACDYHTHRCSPNAKAPREFENGHWVHTPFEVLLVAKLRQRLGLRNPVVDHPLMNTALGRLPDEVPFAPDGLIARVRARMMQDGYDEQAIYESVMAGA